MPRRTGPQQLLVASRQRKVAYDHALLETLLRAALPMCRRVAEQLGGRLANLPLIECSVVGRRGMARIHREFLGIPGATDVITFPYGEILICAPVAADRAQEFRHSVTAELALYGIHGLLHLAGHDDVDPACARRMVSAQNRILRNAFRQDR